MIRHGFSYCISNYRSSNNCDYAVLLLKWTSPTESKNAAPATAATGLTYPSGFNMKNNWGSLSPYFDTGATFPEIDPTVNEGLHELPKHCKLQQVHVLHRHAERFPTSGSGASMEATAFKLKHDRTSCKGS